MQFANLRVRIDVGKQLRMHHLGKHLHRKVVVRRVVVVISRGIDSPIRSGSRFSHGGLLVDDCAQRPREGTQGEHLDECG